MDEGNYGTGRHLALRHIGSAGGVGAIPEDRSLNSIVDGQPFEALPEPRMHESRIVAGGDHTDGGGAAACHGDGKNLPCDAADQPWVARRWVRIVEMRPLPVSSLEPNAIRFGSESQPNLP